jgi:4a-hydroxytetrahydrobiopterin dehydratase
MPKIAAKEKPLSKSHILKSYKGLDAQWNLTAKDSTLTRVFAFDDHVSALVFIARVTVHAQVLNHHPDILFTYKKVKVTLTTHDVKGLSQKDFELAKALDRIPQKGG